MSAYSNVMVTELTHFGGHTYESATEFASKHNLSTRSVVSKIKSLGLEYTKKPIAGKVVRIRKADVVHVIETKLGLKDEALSGLGKADLSALLELLGSI